uniref:Uncharacterized protein n=1 Tax=Arundo donax TaxID=35708 RepID=A0A0A8Y6K2_ARUDO
MQRICYPSQFT